MGEAKLMIWSDGMDILGGVFLTRGEVEVSKSILFVGVCDGGSWWSWTGDKLGVLVKNLLGWTSKTHGSPIHCTVGSGLRLRGGLGEGTKRYFSLRVAADSSKEVVNDATGNFLWLLFFWFRFFSPFLSRCCGLFLIHQLLGIRWCCWSVRGVGLSFIFIILVAVDAIRCHSGWRNRVHKFGKWSVIDQESGAQGRNVDKRRRLDLGRRVSVVYLILGGSGLLGLSVIGCSPITDKENEEALAKSSEDCTKTLVIIEQLTPDKNESHHRVRICEGFKTV